MSFSRYAATLLAASTFSFTASGADYDPDTLRVALLPDEDAATIIRQYAFAAYLESQLGKEVSWSLPGLVDDRGNAVWANRHCVLRPCFYTIAKDKMAGGKIDIEPFAARMKGGSRLPICPHRQR